jgi:hypothetical protein
MVLIGTNYEIPSHRMRQFPNDLGAEKTIEIEFEIPPLPAQIHEPMKTKGAIFIVAGKLDFIDVFDETHSVPIELVVLRGPMMDMSGRFELNRPGPMELS